MYWRWTFLFVLINLFFPKVGGPNPYSRLAQLGAMAETDGFAIDFALDSFQWTNDWSFGSGDKRFSNKAPGAAFLSYPMYKALDLVQTLNVENRFERWEARWRHKHFNGHILSLIFQVFLTSLLCFYIIQEFKKRNLSFSSQRIFLILVYFASLSSVFMNTFFGHALASTLVLGTVFFWDLKKPLCLGLWGGLSLLTDYSAIPFIVLLFLGGICFYKHKKQYAISLLAGASLPIVLWCWYHYSSFGSVFSLPLAQQNPDFITEKGGQGLAGVFKLIPDSRIFLELLFGVSRGLFWTTPWFFIAIFFLCLSYRADVKLKKNDRFLISATLFYVTLVVCLNANFGAWHGGASPGSRYLSIFMPTLAYTFVSRCSFSAKAMSISSWLVIPSLLFFVAVYSTTLLLPAHPLWLELWRLMSEGYPSTVFRFLGIGLFLLLGYSAFRPSHGR